MKITITKTISEEIELTFPLSVSDGNTFAHFEKENEYGTIIRENINDISRTQPQWFVNIKELQPCDKSEVEAAFRRVVKYHRDLSFGITVSMDDNMPTEVLENL
jgi:hypothetical protein